MPPSVPPPNFSVPPPGFMPPPMGGSSSQNQADPGLQELWVETKTSEGKVSYIDQDFIARLDVAEYLLAKAQTRHRVVSCYSCVAFIQLLSSMRFIILRKLTLKDF